MTEKANCKKVVNGKNSAPTQRCCAGADPRFGGPERLFWRGIRCHRGGMREAPYT
jgi:hypothetical protein